MGELGPGGHIPPWMEKIAAQGGWKEAEKTMTAMSKIKPASWKAMGTTIETLKDFVEGGVVGGFRDIGQDLSDALTLQVEEALAPLTNEVTQALAEALAPIMPYIQDWTAGIGEFLVTSIKSWEAIFTGDWDDFFARMDKIMPKWMHDIKRDFWQWREDMASGQMAKDIGKGIVGFYTDVNRGVRGFASDIGRGWQGFLRDVGSWF